MSLTDFTFVSTDENPVICIICWIGALLSQGAESGFCIFVLLGEVGEEHSSACEYGMRIDCCLGFEKGGEGKGRKRCKMEDGSRN